MWGALREMMHEGRIEERVDVAELLPGPHLYAIGALAGMTGEVTVLDGVAWVARGEREAGAATAATQEIPATLLVAASVAHWKEVRVTEDIPFNALDARISNLAAAAGVNLAAPFPFVVEGEFADVTCHVLKGPPPGGAMGHAAHARNAVVKEMPALTATLVGFFSTSAQGVFTHMGQDTHVHILSPALRLAAHADAVSIRAGSVVKFPLPQAAVDVPPALDH